MNKQGDMSARSQPCDDVKNAVTASEPAAAFTRTGRDEDALLAEADHVYVLHNWECTYPDFGTLSDAEEMDMRGEIVAIGRLVELRPVFAVSLPTTFDEDGDPEDWEATVFETRAEAEAALAAIALATIPDQTGST